MAADNQEVLARLDALEQTFLARLDTLRAEREHGDRQLEQADRFIRENVKDNTAGIARQAAAIETIRHQHQEALNAIRHEINEGITRAIEASSASTQTGLADIRAELIDDITEAKGAINEVKQEAKTQIKELAESKEEAHEKLNERVMVLEDKWKLVRGIAIGLGVTTVIEIGAILALLQEVGTAIP